MRCGMDAQTGSERFSVIKRRTSRKGWELAVFQNLVDAPCDHLGLKGQRGTDGGMVRFRLREMKEAQPGGCGIRSVGGIDERS